MHVFIHGYLIFLIFRHITHLKKSKMTMWADNIKFVKDIIDGKYQKIESAAAEVFTIFIDILSIDFYHIVSSFCR